jgi:hypothetical protein
MSIKEIWWRLLGCAVKAVEDFCAVLSHELCRQVFVASRVVTAIYDRIDTPLNCAEDRVFSRGECVTERQQAAFPRSAGHKDEPLVLDQAAQHIEGRFEQSHTPGAG